MPDVEFVRWLARTKGVVCTPMSVFYATGEWCADPDSFPRTVSAVSAR